jgi:hypothetical protein
MVMMDHQDDALRKIMQSAVYKCIYTELVSHMPPKVGDDEHAKATQKVIILYSP